jgi:DNA-directed RNA polymerase subunit RPC12/RpoP
MRTIIFLIIAVILIIATIYFSLKSKIHCPNCKSSNIDLTGNKKFEEYPPLAIAGSPNSYYNVEYKCSNCGNIFWHRQKAVIFN